MYEEIVLAKNMLLVICGTTFKNIRAIILEKRSFTLLKTLFQKIKYA